MPTPKLRPLLILTTELKSVQLFMSYRCDELFGNIYSCNESDVGLYNTKNETNITCAFTNI